MVRIAKSRKISGYYIWVLILFLMPFQIWSYFDELIAAMCVVYLFAKVWRKQLLSDELKILIWLVILLLLGVISNVGSKINVPLVYIATDALWLCKTFVVFIGFRHLFKNRKKEIAGALVGCAKFVIIFMFLTSLLTQIVDIGMTMEVRYGISAYGFWWKNGIQTAWFLAGCLGCVLIVEKNRKSGTAYVLMSLVVCALTTKGLVWCLPLVFIMSYMLVNRQKRLSLKKILLLAIVIVVVSRYQISTYLLNDTALRYKLIYYGFVTAQEYFPFGSGFATYGSDLATRQYSELYYRYGFNDIWGLSQATPFYLNDNYLGMIVGQFGFVGLIIFGWILYKMFKIVNKADVTKRQKCWALAIFFTIAISMIGSATSKSCMGIFATIFLALLTISDGEATNDVKTVSKI